MNSLGIVLTLGFFGECFGIMLFFCDYSVMFGLLVVFCCLHCGPGIVIFTFLAPVFF